MFQRRALWSAAIALHIVISTTAGTEPVAPAINPVDRLFLTRVARRVMEAYLEGGAPYAPSYVPPELEKLECEVVVTIRRYGAALASGSGAVAPVARSCGDAADAAIRAVRRSDSWRKESLDDVTLEIEALGEPVPMDLRPTAAFTEGHAFERYIEPGIDGIILAFEKRSRRFRPAQIVATSMTVGAALKQLAQQVMNSPEQLTMATMQRFRSAHWVERTPGGSVVSLRRGLTVLPCTSITPEAFNRAIEQLAEYLMYRQTPDGLFRYEYLPGEDEYVDRDNAAHQAGAAWAMQLYAAHSGRPAARAAAQRAMVPHERRVVQLPELEHCAFVATADEREKLSTTALFCLATCSGPNPRRYADLRSRLLGGMLWLQRPSGMFLTAFPPAMRFDSQFPGPGKALLALAHSYTLDPQHRILQSSVDALPFYRKLFEAEPVAVMVPWHIQAFAIMAQLSKRSDFTDFVFAMTDRLLDAQLDERNSSAAELWGGVAPNPPAPAGAATAVYLQAFVAALRLARTVGDDQRAARYERAVRLATRFVLQLQIRPHETYYMPSPPDAVHGTRATLTDSTVRLDACEHALIALLQAWQAIFPSRG